MSFGGSQQMKFCGRDLDSGTSISVEPHTAEYDVEFNFFSDRRRRYLFRPDTKILLTKRIS